MTRPPTACIRPSQSLPVLYCRRLPLVSQQLPTSNHLDHLKMTVPKPQHHWGGMAKKSRSHCAHSRTSNRLQFSFSSIFFCPNVTFWAEKKTFPPSTDARIV